jgi:hypothetical protein
VDAAGLTETSETTTSDTDATALGGGAADQVATSDVSTETQADTQGTAETTALGNAGEKTAETKTEAPVIPDKYDLAAPEGMTLDPASIEAATPVFKELGLTNEQANKLVPIATQMAQRIQDQANQQILSQVSADRKAWLDTAKSDPEIGGAKWDETLTVAASALDKLGYAKGSPFRVLLDESGLGNHPEMIRAFSKMGRAMGESGFAREGQSTAAEQNPARLLYPNDKPQGA